MADILRFSTPLPPVPAPVGEFDRAYAELIDAYNANAEAQRLIAETTVRLQQAHARFEDAQSAVARSVGGER